MPSEEWLKTWIFLSSLLVVTRSARPRFDTSTDMGMVLVPADAEIDSVIFRLRATDQDVDFPLVFDITATITPVVKIENLPCTLYNKVCQANVILTRRLTAGRLHDFAVRVRDSKGDSNSMQATISVTNATTRRDSIFPHIPSIIMVPEDAKPGTELDYLLVKSNPWSGKPVYIELWQPKELFTIRQRQTPAQTRGIIILTGELDFETQSMYTLTIYATDPYTEPNKDTRNIAGLQLVVIVQDVQDVPPIFTLAPPLTKINNTVQPGDVILRVHAEDGDKGVPREVTYGLVSEGNPFTPFFNISESTGEIILARPLEELTQITHVGAPVVLSVVAEEIRRSTNEPPAQATVVEVGLLLGEPGNRPPTFSNDNYVAWMDENAVPGSLIIFNEPYSTRVTDEDIGKAGVFALKLENNNGTFEISPTVAERSANFILTVRDNMLIDYEVFKSLKFKIIAQEVGPATNLSTAVPVTIFLRDVNDNPPVFDEKVYEITVSENITAGSRVIQVHATDKDTGSFGRIQYTKITGAGNEAFIINPDTGVINVAMKMGLLDREITPQLQLSVEARDEDGKGLKGTVPLIVNLLDVNDNPPIFEKDSYEFTLNMDLTNFTSPAIIKAFDADAEPPNNIVRYEIVHGNYDNKFFLNEETGELFLREQIIKIRTNRQNPYQRIASKFRKNVINSQENSLNISSTTEFSSAALDKLSNSTKLENITDKSIRRKREEKNIIFTLTARAYDLGVPHMSSISRVNIIQSPLAGTRTVMFVVPGEHPDPIKTAQTLAAITGGKITVQEIRPYAPESLPNGSPTPPSSTDATKKSIVIARVEQIGAGNSLVDIEKIKAALQANGVGVIGGEMSTNGNNGGPDPRHGETTINSNKTITTIHSEDVTVYRAENKLLFWLLIILGLLILLAIISLIVCCICPACPLYMVSRKCRIHSSETLIARSDGRPRKHLHRQHPIMTEDIWSEKKQAWSADPRTHWRFNRRNANNCGIASLPGDVARVHEYNERHFAPKAMSLRLHPRDGPVPMYLNDPMRRHPDDRIYVEDVEISKARDYDFGDTDYIRQHEFERDSDIAQQTDRRRVRDQHFYRNGNTEVMRLITRGGREQVSATMHRHPDILIADQSGIERVDGKDILLRRFIEDQNLRVIDQNYHESMQDFERQSMESHQRQKEASIQQQQQQEILLIPEKLEQLDHRQHIEEVGPEIQRLIIDHGIYEQPDTSVMKESQDILTGATLVIPMVKLPEKSHETTTKVMNVQSFAVHDVELAKQNALLTRLLLERDGRTGGMIDSASYLETQSLPGQVAAGTQTDHTAATQTDLPNRSRSDNEESEEDARMKRKLKSKKRYNDEPKRIRTLWMRSPIQEEDRQYLEKKTTNIRRKMRDVKDGRKVPIEPEVLREISDSLDETGDSSVPVGQFQKSSNSQHESRNDDEEALKEDSSSIDMIKSDYVNKKKYEQTRGKGEIIKVDIRGENEIVSEPSFRILKKEISSLEKKLTKLVSKKNRDHENDGKYISREKDQSLVGTREMEGVLDTHRGDEKFKKEGAVQSRRSKSTHRVAQPIKDHLKIPEESSKKSSDKSKQKSKQRNILPISTASSEFEDTGDISKKQSSTKIINPGKMKLQSTRTVQSKLQRQSKIEINEEKKSISSHNLRIGRCKDISPKSTSKSEKSGKSETESDRRRSPVKNIDHSDNLKKLEKYNELRTKESLGSTSRLSKESWKKSGSSLEAEIEIKEEKKSTPSHDIRISRRRDISPKLSSKSEKSGKSETGSDRRRSPIKNFDQSDNSKKLEKYNELRTKESLGSTSRLSKESWKKSGSSLEAEIEMKEEKKSTPSHGVKMSPQRDVSPKLSSKPEKSAKSESDSDRYVEDINRSEKLQKMENPGVSGIEESMKNISTSVKESWKKIISSPEAVSEIGDDVKLLTPTQTPKMAQLTNVALKSLSILEKSKKSGTESDRSVKDVDESIGLEKMENLDETEISKLSKQKSWKDSSSNLEAEMKIEEQKEAILSQTSETIQNEESLLESSSMSEESNTESRSPRIIMDEHDQIKNMETLGETKVEESLEKSIDCFEAERQESKIPEVTLTSKQETPADAMETLVDNPQVEIVENPEVRRRLKSMSDSESIGHVSPDKTSAKDKPEIPKINEIKMQNEDDGISEISDSSRDEKQSQKTPVISSMYSAVSVVNTMKKVIDQVHDTEIYASGTTEPTIVEIRETVENEIDHMKIIEVTGNMEEPGMEIKTEISDDSQLVKKVESIEEDTVPEESLGQDIPEQFTGDLKDPSRNINNETKDEITPKITMVDFPPVESVISAPKSPTDHTSQIDTSTIKSSDILDHGNDRNINRTSIDSPLIPLHIELSDQFEKADDSSERLESEGEKKIELDIHVGDPVAEQKSSAEEKKESNIEITSLLNSDDVHSPRRLVIRETSFLNSPRREPTKEFMEITQLETTDEVLTFVDQIPDGPIPELIVQAPSPVAPAEEMKIENLENNDSITTDIAKETTESKFDRSQKDSSDHDRSELSIDTLEDESDVSSESSTKTAFIAQPYGTPRHRQLVRMEQTIDDDALILPSPEIEFSTEQNSEELLSLFVPESDGSISQEKGDHVLSEASKEGKTSDSQTEEVIQPVGIETPGHMERRIPEMPDEKEEFNQEQKKVESISNTDQGTLPEYDVGFTSLADGSYSVKEPDDVKNIEKSMPDSSSSSTGSTSSQYHNFQNVGLLGKDKNLESAEGAKTKILKSRRTSKERASSISKSSIKTHLKKSSVIDDKKIDTMKTSAVSLVKSPAERKIPQLQSIAKEKKSREDRPRPWRRSDREKDIVGEKINAQQKPSKESRGSKERRVSPGAQKKKLGKITEKNSVISQVKELPHDKIESTPGSILETPGDQENQFNRAIFREFPGSLVETEVEEQTRKIFVQVDKDSVEDVKMLVDKDVNQGEGEDKNLSEGIQECTDISDSDHLLHSNSSKSQLRRSKVPTEKGEEISHALSEDTEYKLKSDHSHSQSPQKSFKHMKEEMVEAQSRYMAWYKQNREEMERRRQERVEGEDDDQPPKWLRKSTRQRWLKMSPEDRKMFDLRTPEVTPRTRRKIRPLVNVESEQLKAIVRQGRILRKAEGGTKNDPQIEIFAPEKPPPSSIPLVAPKYHYLIQHSEYKYERIPPPFYLHPPPVPNPSPQMSPLHSEDSSMIYPEVGNPEEDINASTGISIHGTSRLRHQQLLEKKSVFDIAYNEAAPSHLRADSTTPPS